MDTRRVFQERNHKPLFRILTAASQLSGGFRGVAAVTPALGTSASGAAWRTHLAVGGGWSLGEGGCKPAESGVAFLQVGPLAQNADSWALPRAH